MIEQLSISNYALIDNVEIRFAPGLNIITGETGAGKSIMLGALSMLFGNRADTRVVRHADRKSVVEAVFNITSIPAVKSILRENDIDGVDDPQLILRREITPAGRSRSFVNDVPVSLALLRSVAVQLVDIHSQHQNLLLSSPEYQLSIIDTLLPDSAPVVAYRTAFEDYRAALKEYRTAKRALESGRAEEEYFRFQLAKIEELDPEEGELLRLERERDILANATAVKSTLTSLAWLLSNSDNSVVDCLRRAADMAESVGKVEGLEEMPARLDALRIDAADIADTFDSFASSLEADPARLQQIEDRLSDLYSLMHRFSVNSVEELIAHRDDLREKLNAIDNGDEHLKEVTRRARVAKRAATEAAAVLTAARRNVADDLAAQLVENCRPLGMKNIRVEFAFTPCDLSASGADNVSLMVSFNKNQQPMPVKDTASGGEVSRVMLSLKAIVARSMALPTIIFDEIDSGVSGDVANRMGEMMLDISRSIQVIAITHLPQVAAKGSSHFKVYKEDSENATNTNVRCLSPDQRIDELALMLSGDSLSSSARAAAADLLSLAR